MTYLLLVILVSIATWGLFRYLIKQSKNPKGWIGRQMMRLWNETSAKLLLYFTLLKYFSYLYRMKQKLSSPSFADMFLAQRKVKQTFFSQMNTVIDWAPIRAIIEVAYTKGYKSTGRPSYDSLVLFKIELLRTWYGLSNG